MSAEVRKPELSGLRVPIAVRSRILAMADKVIKDDAVFRESAIVLFLEQIIIIFLFLTAWVGDNRPRGFPPATRSSSERAWWIGRSKN
jgi:hypothetical protein